MHAPILPRKAIPRIFNTSLLEWVWACAIGGLSAFITWAVLSDDTPEYLWWLDDPWVWSTLYLGLLLGFALWNGGAVRRFNVQNAAALDHFVRGDIAKALDQFAILQQQWPRPRAARLVVEFNIAWLLMRNGEPWLAIEHYGALDAQRWRKEKLGLWSLLAGHMAYAHGLVGELDAAEAWLAEFERRATLGDTRARLDAGVDAARAIVSCRRGNAAGSAQRLAEEWITLENGVAGIALRPLRVVRAFAQAQANAANSAKNVEVQLGILREGPSNQLTYLGAEWPEMRAFLAQHGFAHGAANGR